MNGREVQRTWCTALLTAHKVFEFCIIISGWFTIWFSVFVFWYRSVILSSLSIISGAHGQRFQSKEAWYPLLQWGKHLYSVPFGNGRKEGFHLLPPPPPLALWRPVSSSAVTPPVPKTKVISPIRRIVLSPTLYSQPTTDRFYFDHIQEICFSDCLNYFYTLFIYAEQEFFLCWRATSKTEAGPQPGNDRKAWRCDSTRIDATGNRMMQNHELLPENQATDQLQAHLYCWSIGKPAPYLYLSGAKTRLWGNGVPILNPAVCRIQLSDAGWEEEQTGRKRFFRQHMDPSCVWCVKEIFWFSTYNVSGSCKELCRHFFGGNVVLSSGFRFQRRLLGALLSGYSLNGLPFSCQPVYNRFSMDDQMCNPAIHNTDRDSERKFYAPTWKGRWGQ